MSEVVCESPRCITMRPDLIEEYRERFRHAPHGVWSTCATRPADQIIRFFDDRRGVLHVSKRLGGGIIHFEWQPHEEGCLQIRRIEPRTGLPKDGEEWLFFRYEFTHMRMPDGDDVAMRMLEFGRIQDFNEPLYYHGRARHDGELVDEEPGPRPESLPEQLHGRMLIAFFIAGMFVGLGMFVAGLMEEEVHPLIYVLGGLGLFIFLYVLMSRPPKSKPIHHDDYIRESE